MNKGKEYSLTIGKTYDVLVVDSDDYYIVDDNNYNKEYFKPVEEN